MRRRAGANAVVCLSVMVILSASGCTLNRARGPAEPSPKDFKSYFDQGVALFNRGEYFGAANALSRALAVKPGSAAAHNLIGVCHFQQKEYAEARAHFEQAIAADPSYAQAFNNLAGVYFVQTEYDRAETSFKKALEIKPDLVSALYSLGNLYISRDRVEEGQTYIAKAIKLDPDYLETHQSFITETPQEGFRSAETYFLYAKLFAQAGNASKTVIYLAKAEQAGFKNWEQILIDTAFDKIRDAAAFQEFLRARLKF